MAGLAGQLESHVDESLEVGSIRGRERCARRDRGRRDDAVLEAASAPPGVVEEPSRPGCLLGAKRHMRSGYSEGKGLGALLERTTQELAPGERRDGNVPSVGHRPRSAHLPPWPIPQHDLPRFSAERALEMAILPDGRALPHA